MVRLLSATGLGNSAPREEGWQEPPASEPAEEPQPGRFLCPVPQPKLMSLNLWDGAQESALFANFITV